MDKFMVLKPRISEKTYMLSQTNNTYVVEVPGNANKDTITKAMAAQFGVTAVTVNVINVKGKPKRTVRKGGRPTKGRRSDFKKAYVMLKEGESLPFFAEPEDDKKSDAKKDKKTTKKEEGQK